MLHYLCYTIYTSVFIRLLHHLAQWTGCAEDALHQCVQPKTTLDPAGPKHYLAESSTRLPNSVDVICSNDTH